MPIWYELLTNDAKASQAFYENVIGWKLVPPPPDDPKHYWTIDAATAHVGGMMQLTDAMRSQGAKPTWLVYFGVEDVDSTVKEATELGAKVLMPAFDIPNVGRFAMLADPQGNPFYVMRGGMDETSTAYERMGMGKCNWNELSTPDPTLGMAFYQKLFGWKYPDKMDMPGGEAYTFIHVGDGAIGATMKTPPGAPSGWNFYFRTPDIDATIEKIKAAGGKVHAGPHEVPGGDKVIVASDPQGVVFGVASPGRPS